MKNSIQEMASAPKDQAIERELLYTGTEGCALGQVRWIGSTRLAAHPGKRSHFSPRWSSQSYALIFLAKGKCFYHGLDTQRIPLHQGDLFFLFPGLPIRYEISRDEDWEEAFAVFNGPVFDLWRATKLLDPLCPLWYPARECDWGAKLHALVTSEEDGALEPLQLISRLMNFLSEARSSQSATRVLSDDPTWLQTAKLLLEDHARQAMSLSQVAAVTGLSYDTFRRQFTRATGVSPARYRMEKRLAAASDLLLHTPLSAKQIAASLGFSSTFHFSDCFLKATGTRPSEFRKRASRLD